MKNLTQGIVTSIALIIIIFSTVKAQTNVSGGIYSNTTWTLANSPYIVVDTVVIFPGVTLTIEPGVEVKFNNNKLLESRQGRIIAIGTNQDSIKFTSNAVSPVPGSWARIHINGDTLVSVFDYCSFSYAAEGIYNEYYNGQKHLSTEISVQHSGFYENITGVFITNVDDGGITYIDSCNFFYNTHSVRGANLDIHASKMNNNQYGIIICSVTNKTYTWISNCEINSNLVGVNGSCATIHFSIRNSSIDSNLLAGVIVYDYLSIVDTIINCEIKNNGTGLIDSFGHGLFIHQSLIESNGIGLRFKNLGKTLTCNKICNNLNYDLVYQGTAGTLNASDNYWCTADSTVITTRIYDGYDNFNYGLVTFMPIDTTQCYLTGCNLSIATSVTNATCDTCHNGSAKALISNGFAPYVYTWYSSPIQTTQTATGLSSGNYTICVTDAKGCTACNSVFVDSTNCTGFMINANAKNATCSSCNDGFAWVNIAGGTAPYSYTWYTSPIQTTDTATGLLQGNYFVCVTDLYGCSACDSVTVSTGNCSAHFDLYPDTIPHNYLAVNMASGVSPMIYSWDWGDSSPFDTVPFPSHTYAVAGFYSICLTITDSVGCTNLYCNSYYLMKNTNTMVYLNVVPQGTTVIPENSDSESFLLFPNPASDYLEYPLQKSNPASTIKIFNLLGELEFFSTNQMSRIDISTLPNGIHMLEIHSVKNIYRGKFFKQQNIR